MAAPKSKKSEKSTAAGAHIRARIAYLHKAAVYLQTSSKEPTQQGQSAADDNDTQNTEIASKDIKKQPPNILRSCIPRHYINQMRGIALKTQQRLSQETKRDFCKRCDLLLIPGVTCTEEICNQSKDRQKKPWADVLVVRCKACETEKRFPQNQKRTPKRAVRKLEKTETQVKASEGKDGS